MTENPDTRHGTPSGSNGTSAARAIAESGRLERDSEALRLRLTGATFKQIAAALGVSKATAFRIVDGQLLEAARRRDRAADTLIALEEARLDALQAALWPAAMAGDPKPVQQILGIMKRRATLLGLDLTLQDQHGDAEQIVVVIDPALVPPRMDAGQPDIVQAGLVAPLELGE